MAKKRKLWHQHLEGILQQYMEVMSHMTVVEDHREMEQHFRVDFYCRVDPNEPACTEISGILPFDHLLEFNIIEYKSIHQGLDRLTFEEYIARAQLFRTRKEKKGLFDRLTLTILLTSTPQKLFKQYAGEFEQLTPWKFRTYARGIPVYILIQKRMRGIDGGEPLAWLQVMEGDVRFQKSTWTHIMNQDTVNSEDLRKVMLKLNREAYMTIAETIREEAVNLARPKIIEAARPKIIEAARPRIAEEAIEEARPKILAAGLIVMLRNGWPHLLPNYESALEKIKNQAEYDELSARVMTEISKK